MSSLAGVALGVGIAAGIVLFCWVAAAALCWLGERWGAPK